MKKFAILLGLAILALIIDGSLSYDIFDTRPESLKVWLLLALVVVLGMIIVVADSSKTHKDENDSQ